MVVSRIKAKAP